MGLLAALVALLCICAPGTSLSSLSDLCVVKSKLRFQTTADIHCETVLQRGELKDAALLDTWRMGRRFSVMVDCW